MSDQPAEKICHFCKLPMPEGEEYCASGLGHTVGQACIRRLRDVIATLERQASLHNDQCATFEAKIVELERELEQETQAKENLCRNLQDCSMEGTRNDAENKYFQARPQLMRTLEQESLFRAGFERGFGCDLSKLVLIQEKTGFSYETLLGDSETK